jgi:hypothetical protein
MSKGVAKSEIKLEISTRIAERGIDPEIILANNSCKGLPGYTYLIEYLIIA